MILVLVLLIVLAVLLIWQPWSRRDCDWQPDARKLADGRVLFSCPTCGAELALPKGQVPHACLAGRQ